eukprot:Transcript_26716.p1 GENE.Transcript_26716~~Transcript_26716.p1  ORF type:complete len:1344 (+),score=457.27 Transcript_26716:146-4033(+)
MAAGGGEAVASVACGAFHSLLVGAAGSLWSAGRNVSGQCGVGHASSPVPASGVGVERVEGLGVRALQASGGGHHSLVLSQGGQVYAFGCNQHRRLGLWAGGEVDCEDRHTPCLVELEEAACQVAAGGDCSLVLTEGGRLLDLGGSGLYRDVEVRRGAPLPVRGLPAARRVASVSAGYDHCLCVDSEGGVWTWGAKGRTSPFNYVAPEGLAPPDQGARDAGRADRAAAAAAECGGADHWPPELLPASAALPARYVTMLAEDDPRLPETAPVTRAEACYPTPTHFCVHLLSERGRLRYAVDTGRGAIPAAPLRLTRLKPYTFQMVGVHAAHPLLISTSPTGPDVRHTTGIIGTHPASGYAFFLFTPSAETPRRLWYQSASQAGLGGPIFIDYNPGEEPRTLPGGDPAYAPHPHALLVWDDTHLSRCKWSDHGPALQPADRVPLADAATAALRNATATQWQVDLAAAMANAPRPPEPSENGTNATDSLGEGNGSNATNASAFNFTAIYEAFLTTLPTMPPVAEQRIRAVAAWPVTGELLFSTQSGHLFQASMRDAADDGRLEVAQVRSLLRGNDSEHSSLARYALRAHLDLEALIYLDGVLPRRLDLRTGGEADVFSWIYDNGTHLHTHREDGTELGPPPAERTAEWFDPHSPLEVDWRARRIFWCQPSRRRILTASVDEVITVRPTGGFGVLTLVSDTVCSSLAVDVMAGELYWSSPTGHAVFRVSYLRYNATYVQEHPDEPLYSLVAPPGPALTATNNSGVQTVVAGHGLAGDYGKDPRTSPLLLAAVADDPDDGDATFGTGDVITLYFDRPTNVTEDRIGNLAVGDDGRPETYVDQLFTLTEPLGDQYEGMWHDASTFEITVVNGWLPQPNINATFDYTEHSPRTLVWIHRDSGLRSADQSHGVHILQLGDPFGLPVLLTGSTGHHNAPQLLFVHGEDPDNGDDAYTDDDLIKLQFDVATFEGTYAVEKQIAFDMDAINALFDFEFQDSGRRETRKVSLGQDYSGAWTDSSTFLIHVIESSRQVGNREDGRRWDKMPKMEQMRGGQGLFMSEFSVWVRVVGDVRSLGRQSPRSTSYVPIMGTWGERNPKPSLVSVSGFDYDNADNYPSKGDILTIQFDRGTNRGAQARPKPPAPGTKAYVDFFFEFVPNLGAEYKGQYQDDSTFIVEILGDDPEWVELEPEDEDDLGSQLVVKKSANIKTSAGYSDAAQEVWPLRHYHWGLPGRRGWCVPSPSTTITSTKSGAAATRSGSASTAPSTRGSAARRAGASTSTRSSALITGWATCTRASGGTTRRSS